MPVKSPKSDITSDGSVEKRKTKFIDPNEKEYYGLMHQSYKDKLDQLPSVRNLIEAQTETPMKEKKRQVKALFYEPKSLKL